MLHRRAYLAVIVTILISASNAIAEPLFTNSGFELGTMENWTQTIGTAFVVGSDFTPFFTAAPEGTYAASTYYPQGRVAESEQATIKSINFTVPTGMDIMEFYISGWSDTNIHVDVKKASDNSVIWSQIVPSTSANFAKVQKEGFSAYAGQDLYIEAIDMNVGGDPAAASGWLGVDGFAWKDSIVETEGALFPNSGFEHGNLNNWTQTVGTAWKTASGTEFNPWFTGAPEGTYAGSTMFPAGSVSESEQATLRSIDFTVPTGVDMMQYFIAGWNDPSIHVDIKKTSDNSVVWSQTVPATSASFVKVLKNGFSAYAGQQLYIEAVDENVGGDPAAANGWVGIDGFAWVVLPVCETPTDLAFPNADFESGDFTNWTVNGDAFAISTATWPSDGWQCNYHATSFTDESFTGSLQSINFKMTSNLITFKIGGWRETPGGGENWNYVTLNRASDGAEIDRVLAPNITGTMSTEYLDGSSVVGQNVYIMVLDEAANYGYAWITVDNFRIIEGLPPCDAYTDLAFPNADFETGDLTGWTVTGDAFGASLNTWPSSGFHCNYVGTSYPAGESKTGSIQSPSFLLTKTGVSFKIGGWREVVNPDPEGQNWNYVTLHRASDGTELDRVLAPNVTGVMKNEMLNGTAALNQNVYIKVTDEADGGGFAWMSVDAFRITDYFPPEKRSWPITIAKVTTPPTIDGNINAGEIWSSLPAASKVDMRLSTLDIVDPNDPSFKHNGGTVEVSGTIGNDADGSGWYYFAYDNNALYIAADVADESINANTVAHAVNGGDAFQVCLDYDLTKVTDADTNGKVFVPSVAAYPGTGTAGTEDNSPYFSAFWPTTGPNPMTGTQWGVTVTEGTGYKVELAIPWTAFIINAPTITYTNPFPPIVGQKMGVLLTINDHDGGTGQGITFMFAAGGGQSFRGETGTVVVRRADMYPEATFGDIIVKVDDWSLY